MKKLVLMLVALFASMSMSAQELREISDKEFATESTSARYAYMQEIAKKRPWQEEIKKKYGNSLEPDILFTKDVNGSSAKVFFVGGYFADYMTYGLGAGIGHEYRYFGWDGTAAVQYAKPDEASHVQDSYWDARGEAKGYWKCYQFREHRSDFRIGIGYSVRVSKYDNLDKSVVVNKETSEDGSIITTETDERQNLHIVELTSGVFVYAGYHHKIKWSNWGWYVEASYGGQQNIKLNSNKFYSEVRASIGVEYRFGLHPSYNHAAMKQRGLTEDQVWSMRNDKPFQTPSK